VSAKQPGSQPHWVRGNLYKGGYSSSGLKSDEVGNGSQGRRAAEGTVLEIRLTPRMVVMPMVRRSAAGVARTELHQERGATRGHEPNGDIGTKDERGQQYDGQHIGSPGVTQPSLHDWGRHHARVSVIVPVETVASRCRMSDNVNCSMMILLREELRQPARGANPSTDLAASYSGSVSPEPPISAGMFLNFGLPSLMGSTVS
jgi:hypothetical protein